MKKHYMDIRTPDQAKELDKKFEGSGKNLHKSSPYKYNAWNSPLKDYQNSDGTWGNHSGPCSGGGSDNSSCGDGSE